jgi:hypothetical protein
VRFLPSQRFGPHIREIGPDFAQTHLVLSLTYIELGDRETANRPRSLAPGVSRRARPAPLDGGLRFPGGAELGLRLRGNGAAPLDGNPLPRSRRRARSLADQMVRATQRYGLEGMDRRIAERFVAPLR